MPSALAQTLFTMGSTMSTGTLLAGRKKEFGLEQSFERLENVS